MAPDRRSAPVASFRLSCIVIVCAVRTFTFGVPATALKCNLELKLGLSRCHRAEEIHCSCTRGFYYALRVRC